MEKSLFLQPRNGATRSQWAPGQNHAGRAGQTHSAGPVVAAATPGVSAATGRRRRRPAAPRLLRRPGTGAKAQQGQGVRRRRAGLWRSTPGASGRDRPGGQGFQSSVPGLRRPGWWSRTLPADRVATRCPAHHWRKCSLWTASSPTSWLACASLGCRPTSTRSAPAASAATVFQSRKSSRAPGSRISQRVRLRSLGRKGREIGEEQEGHPVPGEDVGPAAQHHGRDVAHGLQELAERRTDSLRRSGRTRAGRAVFQEVHHVRVLAGVQPEGPGHGVQHGARRVDVPPLLQADVVVRADACQLRHLLAPEAGNAARAGSAVPPRRLPDSAGTAWPSGIFRTRRSDPCTLFCTAPAGTFYNEGRTASPRKNRDRVKG